MQILKRDKFHQQDVNMFLVSKVYYEKKQHFSHKIIGGK